MAQKPVSNPEDMPRPRGKDDAGDNEPGPREVNPGFPYQTSRPDAADDDDPEDA